MSEAQTSNGLRVGSARFALLAAGEATNAVGSWAAAVAIWGFAAYRFHAGPLGVAVLTLCWAAPPALLGPLLGVPIDRVGPRRALIIGYLAAAAAALAMATAHGLGQLDLFALLYGSSRALTGPAAAALPPSLVADTDLVRANAVFAGAASGAQILGPLAAGAVIAAFGFKAAFTLDAITYLVGMTAMASLTHRQLRHASHRQRLATELSDGFRVARGIPTVMRIIVLDIALTLASAAFIVYEPLYTRGVLHRPPSQFAFFEAAAGIGAVAASIVASLLGDRLLSLPRLSVCVAAYGVAGAVFLGTSNVTCAYIGAVMFGIAAVTYSVAAVTMVQRSTPRSTHGRVLALRAAITSGTETASYPLGGAGAGLVGVRIAALGFAAIPAITGTVSATRRPQP